MYMVVLLAVLGAAPWGETSRIRVKDYCYCSTSNRVNVRAYACGKRIGIANKDECFKDLRRYSNCTLNGKTYGYRKIRFNSKDGWIADNYLRRKRCPASNKGQISQSCLNCICKATCNCECAHCRRDANSVESCGQYQIKEIYHKDCYKYDPTVLSDWKTCTTASGGYLGRAKSCSERCVRAYTKHYGTRCTGGREPTCEDYARIHHGGPKGCQSKKTLKYGRKVKACCDRTRGGC